jgi:YfiR/HmsC-like
VNPDRGSIPGAFSRRTLSVRRPCRIGLCAVLLVANVCFARSLSPQQSKPQEYEVKAVYLYNFGRFVQWPAATPVVTADDSFTVCVLGRDPFGPVLDTTLGGEVIDGRKLVAKRIANTRDATHCRIIFISSSESARIKEILNSLEKSSALTVSDIPDFLNNGGMIQFVLKDNKVRFEVNLIAAEKASLTISSQLLKVATDIKRQLPLPSEEVE